MSQLTVATFFHREGDLVEAEIYLTDGGQYITDQIDSGYLSLKWKNPKADSTVTLVELDRLTLSPLMQTTDGPIRCRFLHPSHDTDLQLDAQVTLTNTTILNYSAYVLETPVENPAEHLAEQPMLELPTRYPDVDNEGVRSLDSNVVIQSPALDPLIADLNFSLKAPVVSGQGVLSYTGGGNRFFPAGGLLVPQLPNAAPWESSNPVFVEDETNNLAPNPIFSPDVNAPEKPAQYEVAAPGLVVDNRLVNDLSDVWKTWQVRIRGVNTVNPFTSVFLQARNPMAFDTTKPLTGSLILGFEYPVAGSQITVIRILVTYRDNANTVLGSESFDFSTADFLDTMAILQWTVRPNYPIGTTTLFWQLEVGSIEAGDTIQLNLVAPQFEYGESATSRVYGGTRQADLLKYTVPDITQQGTVLLQFVAGYNGWATTQNRYFFDTRSPSGDGFFAYQRTDGYLVFSVQNGLTADELVSAAPFDFQAGQNMDLSFSWGTNQRRIVSSTTVLGESTSTFTLPGSTGDLVIGATEAVPALTLDGEILKTTLLRDIR